MDSEGFQIVPSRNKQAVMEAKQKLSRSAARRAAKKEQEEEQKRVLARIQALAPVSVTSPETCASSVSPPVTWESIKMHIAKTVKSSYKAAVHVHELMVHPELFYRRDVLLRVLDRLVVEKELSGPDDDGTYWCRSVGEKNSADHQVQKMNTAQRAEL